MGLNKTLGCLYGLAIGDALGFPVEFMDISEIKIKHGRKGINDFHPLRTHPAGSYSDDTQMSLAITKALIKTKNPNSLDEVMENISDEFVEWANSSENNRAPGTTCMRGCRNLEQGMHWKKSGDIDSKGCGAAMRSAPIGLLYNDIEKVVEVAHAASACTHAHPTGIASGIATACLAYFAMHDYKPEEMIDKVCELTDYADTLGEFRKKMLQVKEVLDLEPEKAMPKLGKGWIGEEAVAIAMYAFLKSPNDYKKTVLTAANITGDSDSTACIAGAISGAYNGIENVPKDWVEKVENSEVIRELAEKLYEK